MLLHPAIAESGFAALGAATSCLVALLTIFLRHR